MFVACEKNMAKTSMYQSMYQSLCKNFGFMNNKRQQLFVVGLTLLGGRLILDTNVTLLSYDDGPTLVMSYKKTHLQYTINNPTLKWACYNYVNAQCGNICKHQLNVLMFIHPNLAEGIIVQFCGSLKGTSQGVLKNLLSPQVGTPPPPPT